MYCPNASTALHQSALLTACVFDAGQELALEGDHGCMFEAAQALVSIQLKFGLIGTVCGQGPAAKQVRARCCPLVEIISKR